MMCSNTLSGDSSSCQLDLLFLGATQFFMKATRLVLRRCCLWLALIFSLVLFVLVLTSPTQNFECHLFQVQSDFFFFVSFSRIFSVMLNSFALVICSLKCFLTFSTHSTEFVLSSFSRMFLQNSRNFFSLWATWTVLLSTF